MVEAQRELILRDPRRRKVNRLLGRVGPGLQQLHRDGCRVVDGVVKLESGVNVIGNCAREIESAVRGVLADITLEHADTPPCRDECARCGNKIRHFGQSHREEIKAILASLKIDGPEVAELWLELTDLARLTHRRGLERVRPLVAEHKETWRKLEDLLAIVLPHLEARLLELLPKYRRLAEVTAPTKADLKEFRRLPNTYRLRREFIDSAGPGWFALLDQNGFFDQPEDAFDWDPTEEELVPRHWPAIDYMVRMSKITAQQERFVAVFERLDPPHEWAVNDLVAAAQALPIEFAVRCAAPLRSWIERQSNVFLAGRTIADFAADLATRKQGQLGADLLRALLALEPDPHAGDTRTPQEEALFTPTPVARLRDHEYEVVVEHGLIELAKADPVTGLALSIDLLSQALELSERGDRVSSRRDSSTWWRRSLEDGRDRYRHEAASVLTDAVLDAARARLSADAAAIADVASELEAEEWSLFRRIAFHVLSEYPDLALIRGHVLDPALVEYGGSWPEFRKLLSDHFGSLDPESQRRYVQIVEADPGDGSDPDYTGGVEHREWMLRRLRPVTKWLTSEERQRYPELIDQAQREWSSDEAEVDRVGGWIGNKPELSTDELRALSDNDLIARLKSWVPPGTLGGPTIEGQGDALRAAVVAEPMRFAAAAMSFRGLDYTYVRAIFGGLDDVMRAGTAAPFEWGPVLDLASWVLAQPPVPVRSSWSQDPDWSWTRKAIADLVHEGLGERAMEISFAEADQVWSLISALAEEADARAPRGTDTEDEAADEEDALSAALNSTRGEALQAAISFAAWRWRHLGKPANAITDAPAASEFLARHVDHRQDPSLAARGVFGSRLPNLIALDETWVREHLDLLFPASADLVRRLTWQSYVMWNRPYTGVRAVISDEYRAAIDRLGPAGRRTRLDVGEKLAEHLMSFYLRGDIDLASSDGLLAAFYAQAPAAVRGQATEFIGQVLHRGATEVTPEHCERLRSLWGWRYAQASQLPHADRRTELENFGWWVASDACDQEWLLAELIKTLELIGSIESDSLVMEKLVTLAPTRADNVLHAVELMIETPKERWQVHVWIDDIVAIIRDALGSPAEQRARNLGARLIADNFDDGLIALLSPAAQSN